MVLAGGEGRRLYPLTRERAKPAVPFGGRYRIIDFVLTNFVNSGIHRIKVLTQYRSDSLLRHILRAWNRSIGVDGFVEPVPPQWNRGDKHWYAGSIDAIFQNINVIADEKPDLVAVFGADHIYKMDVRQVLSFHRSRKATVTVATIPVPLQEGHRFGCISVDDVGRMTGFVEKPENPPEIPGQPGYTLASMGNYIFDANVLVREAEADAERDDSHHDFGRDLLPKLFEREPVFVYNFKRNSIRGEPEASRGYWVDVGTIDAYYRTSMDLVSISPTLNLYNPHWPIRAAAAFVPPAKFVLSQPEHGRVGTAIDSMVAEGTIISGGRVERSVLFTNTRVNSYAHIEDSIVFPGSQIGRHCRIRRTIIDKGVVVPSGTTIGYDLDADREKWTVTEEGIVIVPKHGFLAQGSRDLPE